MWLGKTLFLVLAVALWSSGSAHGHAEEGHTEQGYEYQLSVSNFYPQHSDNRNF